MSMSADPTLTWNPPTASGPGAPGAPGAPDTRMISSTANPQPCQKDVTFGTGPGQLRPDTLVIMSRELLSRVQVVYAEAGVALPDRQIRSVGEVAHDCEQLVVAFTEMRETHIPSWQVSRNRQTPHQCQVPVVAVFDITVVRCVPVPTGTKGTPPTPAEIAKAADLLVTDAYLLMKAGCRFDMYGADIAWIQQQTNPGAPPYSSLGGMGTEATVHTKAPQGGLQEVNLNLVTVVG